VRTKKATPKMFCDTHIPLAPLVDRLERELAINASADPFGIFAIQFYRYGLIHFVDIKSVRHIDPDPERQFLRTCLTLDTMCRIPPWNETYIRHSFIKTRGRHFAMDGKYQNFISDYIVYNNNAFAHPSSRIFSQFPDRRYICQYCLRRYDPFKVMQLSFDL
jgi:hypothetical protein